MTSPLSHLLKLLKAHDLRGLAKLLGGYIVLSLGMLAASQWLSIQTDNEKAHKLIMALTFLLMVVFSITALVLGAKCVWGSNTRELYWRLLPVHKVHYFYAKITLSLLVFFFVAGCFWLWSSALPKSGIENTRLDALWFELLFLFGLAYFMLGFIGALGSRDDVASDAAITGGLLHAYQKSPLRFIWGLLSLAIFICCIFIPFLPALVFFAMAYSSPKLIAVSKWSFVYPSIDEKKAEAMSPMKAIISSHLVGGVIAGYLFFIPQSGLSILTGGYLFYPFSSERAVKQMNQHLADTFDIGIEPITARMLRKLVPLDVWEEQASAELKRVTENRNKPGVKGNHVNDQ